MNLFMCLQIETNSSRGLSSDMGCAFMIPSFSIKQVTFSSITCAWVGFASYRPLKVIIYAGIFQLPDIF